MKYLPKVSIVIPAYNASNYLAEAIESALVQTYKNIEIVVVNDGSQDDGATARVAALYSGKIRYFEKENGGSSSAINYGLTHMDGEWFSWLSHDDLYYPEKIERQISFLNVLLDAGEDIYRHVIFAASELINARGQCIYRKKASSDIALHKQVEAVHHNCYLVAEAGGKYTFHGCSCLIHKSVFDSVGLFDENLRLVNDVDMWKRIFMSGYHVHYLPEPAVKGRVHAKQISAQMGFSYHNPEQDTYWNSILEWLIACEVPAEDKKNALYLFSRCAYQKTRGEEATKAARLYLEKATEIERIIYRAKHILFKIQVVSKNIAKMIYRKIRT